MMRNEIQIYYDELCHNLKYKHIDLDFSICDDQKNFYNRLFHTKLFYSMISYIKYKVQKLDFGELSIKNLDIYDIIINKKYITKEIIDYFINDIDEFKLLFVIIPSNIEDLYKNRYNLILV